MKAANNFKINSFDINNQSISIIGSGYIGLVVGACLADFGYKVICADIDTNKINKLKNGIIPIYEPGLEELVKKNLLSGALEFTENIPQAIQTSNIIFIAVNTPTGIDGRADISAVKNVAKVISANLNDQKIVCIKSTVPVGTHKIVSDTIGGLPNFDIASIPEFLREGSAISDFMNPDRIIIGTKSYEAYTVLKEIYSKTNCVQANIVMTDNLAAETIKYVSNSFLALKVSFINEIANFCDAAGVDIVSVAHGVGLDKRIGSQFLKPGPGFGGSCFPKDVQALITMADDFGVELKTIKTTLDVNELQKQRVVSKLRKSMDNNFAGKTIAILGLAFKANTDDIRQAPAINIIKQLQQEGAIIKTYDPKAMDNMKVEIPDIIYCANPYKAIEGSDAILVLTEWDEFAKLDFIKISKLVKHRIILDTRNILDLNNLKDLGFVLDSLGRGSTRFSQI